MCRVEYGELNMFCPKTETNAYTSTCTMRLCHWKTLWLTDSLVVGCLTICPSACLSVCLSVCLVLHKWFHCMVHVEFECLKNGFGALRSHKCMLHDTADDDIESKEFVFFFSASSSIADNASNNNLFNLEFPFHSVKCLLCGWCVFLWRRRDFNFRWKFIAKYFTATCDSFPSSGKTGEAEIICIAFDTKCTWIYLNYLEIVWYSCWEPSLPEPGSRTTNKPHSISLRSGDFISLPNTSAAHENTYISVPKYQRRHEPWAMNHGAMRLRHILFYSNRCGNIAIE